TIRRDVAQRRSAQTVFVRAATGVVLPVEYVEAFESEVTRNAICERQFFGETRIKTIDPIQIQIADRLEWHARSSAAAAIQRTRDKRPGECIPGDSCRGIYGPGRLERGDRAQLPVVDQVTG